VSTDRERALVELVGPDGAPIGSTTVLAAHTPPGQLHRAFSVLLFDEAGRTLLQQRAAAKTRFPLRWANTCCGHPGPGESVLDAAARRLEQELRVLGVDLTEAGVYVYQADDPATGLVEHEYDHVLVGLAPATLAVTPDPGEVQAVRWARASTLAGVAGGSQYAPWLAGVLPIALAAGVGQ
jgi:isopentenyl-diphosphate Delta-isomerase